jgi:carbon starvation protein
MLMESMVAIMALIAACVLTPGVYFAINAPAGILGTTVDAAAQTIQTWGFTVTPAELTALAGQIGETSVLSRTGGAPSLAIGMAHIFSNVFGGGAMALWYHFAIMFEALFILTTLDAGTRVGRFMLQDLGKHVWEPFGRVSWYPAVVLSSALVVAAWGHSLSQGVLDPLGGVNSLWPLFGISNQLLATVALCVGTTVIIKMGKARYTFITLVPLVWLVAVTMTAGGAKVFSDDPKLGFLSHARFLGSAIESGALPAGVKSAAAARQMMYNDYLDAAVAGFFMISVVVILADSLREWTAIMRGRKPAISSEVPFDSPVPVAGD